MNGVVVMGVVLGAAISLFVVWCCVMNRIDEREQRRHEHEMGRREPPETGDARHLRSGTRRR